MLTIPNFLQPLFVLALAAFTSAAPAPTAPTDQAQPVLNKDDNVPDVPLTVPPADPTPSIDCHYRYCESSTSWCYYWAGVTGYDVSLGPLPGETRTALGVCDPATGAAAPEPSVTQPAAL
jgi:hypothetical protein